MSDSVSIVWFKNDLRLADNPAFAEAAREGGPVLPVFIWDPEGDGHWSPGPAGRSWLRRALNHLGNEFRSLGLKLILRTGDSREVLESLIEETGATSIYWNRRYTPVNARQDEQLRSHFQQAGLTVGIGNASLLFEPELIATRQGKPFKVFTPFWRACMAHPVPDRPWDVPDDVRGPDAWPDSLSRDDLGLLNEEAREQVLLAAWPAGTRGAFEMLDRFLDESLDGYSTARDFPARPGTSRLSPYLRYGEIGPRQIWWLVAGREGTSDPDAMSPGAKRFMMELGWREFAHHLLVHFPRTTVEPLRSEFAEFPWMGCDGTLEAWKHGRTGYPIVDAGMRELKLIGWMHNRVRMIAASFLTKDLLLPWQEGAAWFWETLVDADLANNTLGWQWVAGCGADAAPYFRIFNPVIQGERFDSEGEYIRRWIPELASLPDDYIHRPWEAPDSVLEEAGVELGSTYPKPLVDHSFARERALAAYDRMRESTVGERVD